MKYPILLFLLYVTFSGNFFIHVKARLEGEAIVGGTEATPGQIKYQVPLETKFDNICGGGIIAEKYALTAANCVIDSRNTFQIHSLTVLAAALKALTKNDPKAVRIEVEKIYMLDEFNPINPKPDEFYRTTADLAVLKLKIGLGIASNPLLSVLKLPEAEDNSYDDEKTVVAGFGDNWIYIHEDEFTGDKVEFGSGSNDILRYTEARVIANDKCKAHFDSPIYSTHLCAAVVQRDPDVGEGICSGDSGSPLVFHNDTVIGIVSSSPFGCTEAKSPAVYTRVSSYLPFIRGILDGNVTDNVRVVVLNDFVSPKNQMLKLYEEISHG